MTLDWCPKGLTSGATGEVRKDTTYEPMSSVPILPVELGCVVCRRIKE